MTYIVTRKLADHSTQPSTSPPSSPSTGRYPCTTRSRSPTPRKPSTPSSPPPDLRNPHLRKEARPTTSSTRSRPPSSCWKRPLASRRMVEKRCKADRRRRSTWRSWRRRFGRSTCPHHQWLWIQHTKTPRRETALHSSLFLGGMLFSRHRRRRACERNSRLLHPRFGGSRGRRRSRSWLGSTRATRSGWLDVCRGCGTRGLRSA